MSKFQTSNNMEISASKVIGIQFSILSPDEIRKGSVAEITSRDTFINNKPVIGGLFDPRMGVLEPGLICPTDGLDYMQTPGYFGHIELARPVFYIQYLSTIQKCMRCVCFKCSKLLISKEKYKQALKIQGDARWKYVYSLCSKVKRCGDDSEDGCGTLQPNKIRKEGLATIIAEWKNDGADTEPVIIKVTPEMTLKNFKRISDDDVTFMGFSPIFSRPDWMICQVMLVPPPAVRPSVKHDAQQRSEDDLSHILVNIIKTNKTLQEKIANNAPANVVDDWTTVLQYYVATQVDNKIPGVASVAQRSGRPLKSIKDRLNGKGGRMRGNLMAKRVDFSARSVITADPNISIRELGIPLKIAKNITKPVIVNKMNKAFLTKLVQNGPEVWPGAKMLEKQNGEVITLRYYLDRNSLVLEEGDTVHRHMMDGDAILFNRQPTLHRMSMMCHIAKIMKQGDTFRMNVADTKPYNADFDGDEMNLHMPQDLESEAELRNLAAVPYQIISPGNNSSIIGIYQDSMLGSYQFTREGIQFTPRDAMNLLMMFDSINENTLLENIEKNNGTLTNFNILSQIMPPLSMKYKTKAFKEDHDVATSNNVIEIRNGKYIRGQMDKSVLGAGTKGLLQRVCNDFGNMASAKFIDDLQNIVTEYMKLTAFSVGISDLISDKTTNAEIIKLITSKKVDVKNLIDQVQIGIFENNTGKTNEQEFETQVNSILNQATSEAGNIGLKKLSKNNRFVIMVNAGSKGGELNITQMISCLGQQNVDGKRIPYGFENRTLPHFTKYDDSPGARGFVESSYINGLSPQELFFHAMGGRVGLIDTAVKTSTTGYIQRRLIKGLEDLMVSYDMTIRTNKNKIVQFCYGDDSIDTIKVENQNIPIVSMSVQDIYAHYLIPEESGKIKTMSNIFLKNTFARNKKQMSDFMKKTQVYVDTMISSRDEIIKKVFKNKGDSVVNCPVAFMYIISNIQGQCNLSISSFVDITLLETLEMIEKCYANLEKNHYAPPTKLFKTLYYYYLSPKDLLIIKRFNKAALTLLLDTITLNYKRAIVTPGEMVGMIAGQSIGEISTQMSLISSQKMKIIQKNKINGNITCISVEIGSFCDSLIEKNSDMTFNTGHKNSVETLLETTDDEYYIVGVSKDEKTSWNKISHVSRHPVNGNMMKVTTRSGRIVETTTSHSHLIRSEETQKVEPIVGADMTIGMRIPVAKYLENIFIKDTFLIGNKEHKLDYLFGWFIGTYLAESNLNYTRLSCTSDYGSPHFIENIKKITQLFADTNSVDSEISHLLINNCVDGNEGFAKHIPDFAFTSPNIFKSGLIQSYMDRNGQFINDKDTHLIRVSSRSKQLIKDIALLFNYFEIFASIKETFSRGTILYHLTISHKYSSLYKNCIGSLIHLDKLEEIIAYSDRNIAANQKEYIDKINGLGEIIHTCGKELSLSSKINYKKKASISRNALEKIIYTFEKHPDSYKIQNHLQILKQAANSNVIWDEIINIEYYTPDQVTTFVYDFTVPGNQTFMTDTGVIVHNTLNTFHHAGVSSKSNVTRGVPRIEEILSLSSEIKNPSLSIYLKPEDEKQKDKAQTILYMLEHTKLEEIVKSIEICFDPDDLNTLIKEDKDTILQYREFEKMIDECSGVSSFENDETEKSKWVIRIEMESEVMLEKNITMDDVNFTLKNCFENQISCVYSDFNSDKLIFRIRMNEVIKSSTGRGAQKKIKVNPLDQSDQIYVLKNFQDQLLQNVVLRGVKGINKVIMRKVIDNMVETNGIYKKQEIWVLDTIGTNLLSVLGLNFIDNKRTISNDIIEIYNVLGIEAARQAIYNELVDVVEFDGTYVNYHNYSVLVDRMTYTHKLISIFRHGINNDNIGPISKASFEETPEMFLKAARHAELDTMRGISANVMCGQEGYFGTAAFQVVLNIEELQKMEATSEYNPINVDEEIEKFFVGEELDEDACSISKIAVQNNVFNIQAEDMGKDNSYNPGF